MNEFVQALFDENITKLNKDKREINRKSKAYKLYSLISPNYKKEALGEVDEVMFLYDGTNQYAYEKFQLVTDFVAGMTDKYDFKFFMTL